MLVLIHGPERASNRVTENLGEDDEHKRIIGPVAQGMEVERAPQRLRRRGRLQPSPHWRRTSARHGRTQREHAPALIDLEVAQEAHAE